MRRGWVEGWSHPIFGLTSDGKVIRKRNVPSPPSWWWPNRFSRIRNADIASATAHNNRATEVPFGGDFPAVKCHWHSRGTCDVFQWGGGYGPNATPIDSCPPPEHQPYRILEQSESFLQQQYIFLNRSYGLHKNRSILDQQH